MVPNLVWPRVRRSLKSVAIARILERTAWEQGIRTKLPNGGRRHPWKVADGFRKWFKTRAQLAGMDTLKVEFLMGHDIGLGESYFKPTEQEMLEKYILIVDQLTISNDASKIQKRLPNYKNRAMIMKIYSRQSCMKKMNNFRKYSIDKMILKFNLWKFYVLRK